MKKSVYYIVLFFVLSSLSIPLYAQQADQVTQLLDRAKANDERTDTETDINRIKSVLSSQISPQKAMSNTAYNVQPGDIYKLSYTIGGTVVEYAIVVDANYSIRVSNLGVINVRGKTFVAVKKQVETLVSQNYPLSAVQFVLVSPSIFSVTVKGEVKRTTELDAWALTRASSVLTGLLTGFSSKRKIMIASENGQEREYDLFQASRYGDMTQDPYLRPGDVITVPRAGRIVHLTGAVERTGVYELLESDMLTDVIERYGGGFLLRTGTNKKQIKIIRVLDDELASTETFWVDLEKEGRSFALKDGDRISVESKTVGITHIYLEFPIPLFDKAGMPVAAANGVSAANQNDASAANTNVAKTRVVAIPFTQGDDAVTLIRQNMKLITTAAVDTTKAFILRGSERIPVNLNAILFDPSYNEIIPVEPGDRIIIPEVEQIVTVTGAVVKPGSYPYTPGRTFEYYVALAGGFDYQRNTGSAVIIRDVYGKKLSKTAVIGPNTIITARSNAFMYNFNIYAPLITVTATVLSIITAIITLTKK